MLLPIDKRMVMEERILNRLKSPKSLKRGKRMDRTLCPVCKVRFQIGEDVVKVGDARYVHFNCFPHYRYDSDITEELEGLK
jgi:hypothetical protein